MDSDELGKIATDLRDELLRLRDQTQDVIHDCWKEVETLQQEKDEHIQVIEQLKMDLQKSQQVNAELNMFICTHCPSSPPPPHDIMDVVPSSGLHRHFEKVSDLWNSFPQDAKQSEPPSPSSSRESVVIPKDVQSDDDEMSSGEQMLNIGGTRTFYGDDRTTPRPSSTAPPPTTISSTTKDNQKDEYIQKLQHKISIRDSAILSLEETIEMQLVMMKESTNSDFHDMDCDDDESPTTDNSRAERIEFLESQIDSLEEKIQVQQEMIIEKDYSISMNQNYIEQLATELGSLVDTVKLFEMPNQ